MKGMATMTIAMTYIGEPDIPAGMTIAQYRRTRPRCTPWWRRMFLRMEEG
jgi:hypothetical protein